MITIPSAFIENLICAKHLIHSAKHLINVAWSNQIAHCPFCCDHHTHTHTEEPLGPMVPSP